jgi:hypothetical protein
MSLRRLRVLAAAVVFAWPLTFATGADARTFVIPQIVAFPGSTFDTYFSIVYTAGLAGIPAGGGARVELFLFDAQGLLLEGQTGPVCAPCAFTLSASSRKVRETAETLAAATAGGLRYSTSRRLAAGGLYAIINVSGADPDHVAIQAFTLNAVSGVMVNLPVRELTTGP